MATCRTSGGPGRSFADLVADDRQRAGDAQQASLPIDIRPPKGAQLAPPGTGHRAERDGGSQYRVVGGLRSGDETPRCDSPL
jgi:hypothetical protein